MYRAISDPKTHTAPARGATPAPQTALSPLQQMANASAPVAALAALQQHADMRGAPVQRYQDLFGLYAATPDFAGKDAWLVRFSTAQRILNDIGMVDDSLSRLAGRMLENDQNLQQALETTLEAQWGKQNTVLTGFVPTSTFLNLLQNGQLFRDYVNKLHGVHTHQIQWYILQDNLGSDEAIALFREAGNPRWKTEGKFIWDRVVDSFNKGVMDPLFNGQDFTVPDNLEKYINDKFDQRPDPVEPVVDDVHDAHETQRDTRSVYRDRAPGEWRYTSVMKDAKRIYLDPGSDNIAKSQALASIENEVITNITREEGEIKIMEWTGWIKAEDNAPGPFFIPTVGKQKF